MGAYNLSEEKYGRNIVKQVIEPVIIKAWGIEPLRF
ncbi:UNVERIFIED_CONTAM: hypothetical protein Cloal_3959 [Acetivibrio alkalicellulosi]